MLTVCTVLSRPPGELWLGQAPQGQEAIPSCEAPGLPCPHGHRKDTSRLLCTQAGVTIPIRAHFLKDLPSLGRLGPLRGEELLHSKGSPVQRLPRNYRRAGAAVTMGTSRPRSPKPRMQIQLKETGMWARPRHISIGPTVMLSATPRMHNQNQHFFFFLNMHDFKIRWSKW